ncbi:MAG: type IV secretion system DNA-binding domain-containing protein, partial [Caldilineaceae bacterium]|nr:type IV secretion system DNA-binding domain-containing protein [Caldilineaceae bacterium]
MAERATLARRSVEPPEFRQEVRLVQHLPYISAVSDGVVMLRDGDLMASILVEGIAAATAESVAIEDMATAMAAVVAQATPEIGFAIHRISSVAAGPGLEPVQDDGFAATVDAAWRTYLASGVLRGRHTMVSIVLRPTRLATWWSRMTGSRSEEQRAQRMRRVDRLERVVSTVMAAIGDARPERLTLSDGRWLGLLQTLLTGRYRPISPGMSFMPLADLIATSRVSFRDDTFTVFGTDTASTRYGGIISVKRYPTTTWPGMLDRLDLPIDLVLTQTYAPTESIEAEARIRRTARQMGAADDAAVSLRAQLLEAGDDLASGRVSFGTHHATVTVFADSLAELDSHLAHVVRAMQEAGAVTVREDLALRTAFFAMHPGNAAYRTRPAMISSRNFAELTALHGAPQGVAANQTPWGTSITVFPSVRGEPYRFSFHLPADPGERSVGHTLVLGHTGSGKTLCTAFLMCQALRAGVRIVVFDKDCGLEMPLRAMGGAYSAVQIGVPTEFNPFATECDERGSAWLTDWVGSLVGELSAVQAAALARAVQDNRRAAPGLQTLAHFRSQLRSVDDQGDLHTRLGRWDQGGQHGWLFGGAGVDSLDFSADVTGFDVKEVFDQADVRTAWLSYVFRRIERVVDDGRPTLIVLDEAWKLLDDAYFETRLKDWMLTMRKKNVVVILLT